MDTTTNPTRSLTDTSSQGTGTNSYLDTLKSNLTSDPSNSTGSILDRYDQSRNLIQKANEDQNAALDKKYGMYINDANIDTGTNTTQNLEGGRGFVENLPALRLIVQAGDKRVRDLMSQRDELILQNNANAASKLSDLITNEQAAITNARTAMVQNLLGASAESRNQAGFETPQQTRQRNALTTLITSAPDAGILPTDDLATAAAKYRNSAAYKNNIAQGEANIQAALASASASSASAAASSAQAGQTRTLTGLITGSQGSIGPDNPDVQALLKGTMTPGQLRDKYANYPGGFGAVIAQNILSAAQSAGYNVNAGTLAGIGQQTSTEAANSGNPLSSVFANTRSLFQNNGNGPLSTPPATTGVTPSGIKYTVTP